MTESLHYFVAAKGAFWQTALPLILPAPYCQDKTTTARKYFGRSDLLQFSLLCIFFKSKRVQFKSKEILRSCRHKNQAGRVHCQITMLQNAVAIITGASSGIGAASALQFAARGMRLSLWARDEARLHEVATLAKANGSPAVLPLLCDIRDEGQIAHALAVTLQQFGRIDILINSAGLSLNGEVDGYSSEDWRTVIETNLTGTFFTCRAVLPAMKQQKSGQIINISSGAGRNGIKNMAAYCASKFGVVGFTEALALEVRRDNIRVSALLPGSVATNFSRTAKRESLIESTMIETTTEESPTIGYSLLPSEVASVILAMLEQPSQAWLSEVVLRPLDLELKRSAT